MEHENKKDEGDGDKRDEDEDKDDSRVSQYSLNSESDFELSQCSSSMFAPPGNSSLSRKTPPRSGEPPINQIFEERSQHLLESLERMSQDLVTVEIADDDNENKSSDKTENSKSHLSSLKDNRDNQMTKSEEIKDMRYISSEYPEIQ